MIPFTPQFLTWINPCKSNNNDIVIANLIKKFECMMVEYIQKKKKEQSFYFEIPKEYNCARKQFLENNPMSSEESRKRVGLSKVGRKKMINSEGNCKYVKPEDFSIFLNNGYFFTG